MTASDTERLSRRRVLRASVGVGSAMALAGCLGGGGGGDDGGDDDSGDGSNADSTTQDLCGRIPGEFVAYDAGETAMVCDFDIPSTFEGNFIDRPQRGAYFKVTSEVTSSGGIILLVMHNFPDSKSGSTSSYEYSNRGEVLDIEFNRETVTFYGNIETGDTYEDSAGAQLIGNLPYTVGDTDAYIPTTISTILEAEGEELPDDCKAAVGEVTRQVTESLRVNEETTIADVLEEKWDEPP